MTPRAEKLLKLFKETKASLDAADDGSADSDEKQFTIIAEAACAAFDILTEKA